MPGCLPLIAAILMQKFPGSLKLTCPENQCHIIRRLENWKHEDLAATGYIYNLYPYIWGGPGSRAQSIPCSFRRKVCRHEKKILLVGFVKCSVNLFHIYCPLKQQHQLSSDRKLTCLRTVSKGMDI